MERWFFMIETRLLEMLVEWEERSEQGQPVSIAALCADSPELLIPLQQAIELLLRINHKLRPNLRRENRSDFAVGGEHGERVERTAPVLPGFEVLEELGRGGMGIVYKARQVNVGNRLVAIKTILGEKGSRSTLARRLKSEAEALSRLDSPHVVKVHDVIACGDQVCLVLEYVDGGSLAKRDAGVAMQPTEAATIALTLAKTMHNVHASGILHRDLKPGNILRTRTGHIKITDFGLALPTSHQATQTQTADVAGSPSYMAPEQVLGRRSQIAEWTDVYAIGATLFDLLTGRPPFIGASLLDTLEQVSRADPISPRLLVPRIPRDLETICLKCLEKDPVRRYANAKTLALDLESYLAGRSVSARRPGILEHAWRWSKQHPDRFGLIASVLIALLSVTVILTRYTADLSAERRNSETSAFYGTMAKINERATRRPPGWTWDNLADLKEIAATRPVSDHDSQVNLRTEALKSLTALDVRRTSEVLVGFDAYTLAFSPDGNALVVGANSDNDQMVEVAFVDTRTWARLPSLFFPASLEYIQNTNRPDGVRALAFSKTGDELFIGSRSGSMHVFRWPELRPLRTWKAHEHYVHRICFSDDGTTLFTCSEDRCIKRWKPNGDLEAAYRHSDAVTDILAFGEGSTAKLVAASPRPIALQQHGLIPIEEHTRWTEYSEALGLFTDRTGFLSARGSSLEVFDSARLHILRRVDNRKANLSEVHGIETSPDSQCIAVTSSDLIQIFDTATFDLVASVPAGGRGRVVARFHPEQRVLAACGNDRVTLCELSDHSILKSILAGPREVEELAISADGQVVAIHCASTDGNRNFGRAVVIASARAQGEKHELQTQADKGATNAIAFTPDGSKLCDLRYDGSVLIIDPRTGEIHSTLAAIPSPNALCFSPDDLFAYIAAKSMDSLSGAGDRRPGAIFELNLKTPGRRLLWVNELAEEESRRSKILAFAATDKWLICSSNDANGRIRVMQRSTGDVISQCDLTNYADALVVSRDASCVVVGNRKGEVLVCNLPDLSLHQSVSAHDDGVTALSAAGSDVVLSGGRDRMLRFWKVFRGRLEPYASLGPFSAQIKRLSSSENGTVIGLLVARENAARFLNMNALRNRIADLELGTLPAREPNGPLRMLGQDSNEKKLAGSYRICSSRMAP